jgi:hypothetical protein
VGLVWLPSTVWVGEGVAVNDAVALGEAVVGVGDDDRVPEGDGVAPPDGEEVCAAVVVGATDPGVVAAEADDALGLDCPGAGRSANDPVEDAANAAAPSATSATSARMGTRPTRLPRGKRSRQLGQNPDTGVAMYPQFRHRTGRRFRAMAWLAAFSMRDRF